MKGGLFRDIKKISKKSHKAEKSQCRKKSEPPASERLQVILLNAILFKNRPCTNCSKFFRQYGHHFKQYGHHFRQYGPSTVQYGP